MNRRLHTDGWMDGPMDVQIPPVFYRTSPSVPSRAAAQKGSITGKEFPATCGERWVHNGAESNVLEIRERDLLGQAPLLLELMNGSTQQARDGTMNKYN